MLGPAACRHSAARLIERRDATRSAAAVQAQLPPQGPMFPVRQLRHAAPLLGIPSRTCGIRSRPVDLPPSQWLVPPRTRPRIPRPSTNRPRACDLADGLTPGLALDAET